MTRAWWGTLALTAVLIFGAQDEAVACSCGGSSGPPCQAAWTADVVFAGTVLSTEVMEEDRLGELERSVLVKFKVDRGFVNAAAGPLEIVTSTSGSSCGYSFKAGSEYLVYASKAGTLLRVTICSRTRLLADAQEDLRYLTAISPASGGRVYGRVNEWERDPAEAHAVDYGPMEDVIVSLRGATFAREVRTDSRGRYELASLPPGDVTVSVIPPFGFGTKSLETTVNLVSAGSCGEANFRMSHVTSVFGSVVDASGRPVAGIQVDAVAAELAGFAPPPHQAPIKTDERGVFEFAELPPGTYVFGVDLTEPLPRGKATAPVFLPGTPLPGEAARIELQPGDRKDAGVLRLPQR